MYIKTNTLYFLWGVLICFFSFHVSAQEVLEIKYEDNNKSLSKISTKDLHPDETYFINITGVNTAYMDITINATPKELVSPIPEPLKTILPGITESISIGNAFQILSGIDTISKTKVNAYEKIFEQVELHKKKLNDLRVETKILYDLVQEHKSNSEIVTNKIRSILKSWSNENASLSLPDDKLQLKENILASINYIKSANIFFNNYLAGAKKATTLLENNFIQHKTKIEAIASQYNTEEFLRYWKLIVKANSYTNHKKSNQSYTSDKDLLEAKVTIVNWFTKDTLVQKTLDFYSKGNKLKLGFSSGFIFNNIIEDTYFLKARDTISNSIIRENQDNADITIGALAHLHYQFSSFTSAGISLGLGISPFDGETRYLMGGSILLGKKKQVVISAGAAMSRISVLSGAVSEDDQGLYIPIGQEIPTFKKTQWGYFIGLTYNILRTKK